MSRHAPLIVRELGLQPYERIWEAMRAYTDLRDSESPDELWLLEHPPVYTQGLAGRPEHVLSPGRIPVIATDRGGQVTYHGPGQMVAYPLLDLERLGLGIRNLVCTLEQVVIDVLAELEIAAHRVEGAPGIFVDGAKIASIGMKVRRGCTFHGIAFNLDMDLEPFSRINPCGFAGQAMTRLVDLGVAVRAERVRLRFVELLASALGLDWTFAASHDAEHPLAFRAGLPHPA